MEKYLRDCQKPENYSQQPQTNIGLEGSSIVNRWLMSAANFRPNENNYLNWSVNTGKKKKKLGNEVHGKEELDAAEALTTLANARSGKA